MKIKVMPFMFSALAMTVLGIIFRVAGELTPFGGFLERTFGPESTAKIIFGSILFVILTAVAYPVMKEPTPERLVKWAIALLAMSLAVLGIAMIFYYLIYTGVIAA